MIFSKFLSVPKVPAKTFCNDYIHILKYNVKAQLSTAHISGYEEKRKNIL